jgi:hypothetical protein
MIGFDLIWLSAAALSVWLCIASRDPILGLAFYLAVIVTSVVRGWMAHLAGVNRAVEAIQQSPMTVFMSPDKLDPVHQHYSRGRN